MTDNSTFQFDQDYKPSLVIDRYLASGKFSVYHAHLTSQNIECAVKAYPTDATSLYFFSREKKFLQSFNHPNIIQYISEADIYIQDQDFNILVLEFAPFGDFFDLLASGKLFDECMIREYFHQLVAGVEYLHSQGVAHFDLKPENMLIGKEYQLKITDFDQTHDLKRNRDRGHFGGSTGYRAPEVIEGVCDDIFAADVYSMGIVLYVMVAKELPFAEIERNGKFSLRGYKMFCEDNEMFWRQKRSGLHSTISLSEDFVKLVNGMLAKDPKERMTLQQVKASDWYKGLTYSKEDFAEKAKSMFQ